MTWMIVALVAALLVVCGIAIRAVKVRDIEIAELRADLGELQDAIDDSDVLAREDGEGVRRTIESLDLATEAEVQHYLRQIDELRLQLAERDRVLGPVLECCGRFALEHHVEWSDFDVEYCACPNGLRCTYEADWTHEYRAWHASRRQGGDAAQKT